MANLNAKGRQAGVIAFTFKPFLEGVVRNQLGLSFGEEPSTPQKKKITDGMSDLRAALKLEKGKDLDEAPHTKGLVDMFVKQLWAGMADAPSKVSVTQLRASFEESERIRKEQETELEELRAMLAKNKAAAKKTR